MMKTKIMSLLSLSVVLLALGGCEKELMDFEGKDGLFFDVRYYPSHIVQSSWPHQFFSEASFGTTMDNNIDLTLKVRASGALKNYDRPFKIEINADSTTATSGVDFSGLADEYVIKAGETSTEVTIQAHRTAQMDNDTLQLQLRLVPNEFFDLKYEQYGDYPGTYPATENVAFAGNKDASIHNIFLYDVLAKPKGWWGTDKGGTGLGLFGAFSAKKFRLIMQLTDTTLDDFASQSSMSITRAQALSQAVATYLLEQAKSRETVVLDEDGTMMYVSFVTSLGGSNAWQPYTKPEDYYK